MKEEDIMDNAIANKLRENYVVDLKKPDIDSFERAVIIRKVLDERKWSIREMARQWGFSKSTIEDWLPFTESSEHGRHKRRSRSSGLIMRCAH